MKLEKKNINYLLGIWSVKRFWISTTPNESDEVFLILFLFINLYVINKSQMFSTPTLPFVIIISKRQRGQLICMPFMQINFQIPKDTIE